MIETVTNVEAFRGFMTIGRAAHYLGISTEWLRVLTVGGDMPVMLIDGVRFYDVKDLDAFAEKTRTRRKRA